MAYNFEKLNLLIVDDNQNMRALLRSILVAFGVGKVRESGVVSEAFTEFCQAPSELIIADLRMSPLDGLEFIRLIRSAEDTPDPFVPIIMLTGYSEKDNVLLAMEAGADDVLTKPISPKMLYDRIARIIEKPRQFLKTDTYFGPDRRQKDEPTHGPERRIAKPTIVAPSDDGLDWR